MTTEEDDSAAIATKENSYTQDEHISEDTELNSGRDGNEEQNSEKVEDVSNQSALTEVDDNILHAKETVTDDAKETLAENAKDIVTEGAKETATENITQIVAEDVKETLAEDAKDIVTEGAKETVTENAKDIITEDAKETATENITQIVAEDVKETLAEDAKETVSDDAKETATENITQIVAEDVKEILAEDAKETVSDDAKESAKKNVKDIITEDAKETLAENAKDIVMENAKETVTESAKDIITEDAKETATENVTHIVAEDVKETLAENAKHIVTEDVKETLAENAKHIVTEDVKETLAENAKHIVTEDVKETATENVKHIVTEDVKETLAENAKHIVTEDVKETLAENAKDIVTENAKETATENITQIVAEDVKETLAENAKHIVTEDVKETATENVKHIVTEDVKETATENAKEIAVDDADEIVILQEGKVADKENQIVKMMKGTQETGISAKLSIEIIVSLQRKFKLLNYRHLIDSLNMQTNHHIQVAVKRAATGGINGMRIPVKLARVAIPRVHVTAEAFPSLASELYASLPNTFKDSVSSSMMEYYFMILYHHRLAGLRMNRITMEADETLCSNLEKGTLFVPEIFEHWINLRGDDVNSEGKTIKLILPSMPRDTGDFGRLSAATHWRYISDLAPRIFRERISADLVFTACSGPTEWNLPEDIRPQEQNCGLPTRNLIGYHVAEKLTTKQINLLRYCAIGLLNDKAVFSMDKDAECYQFNMPLVEAISCCFASIASQFRIVRHVKFDSQPSSAALPIYAERMVEDTEAYLFERNTSFFEKKAKIKVFSRLGMDCQLAKGAMVFLPRVYRRDGNQPINHSWCAYDFGCYLMVPNEWIATRNNAYKQGSWLLWHIPHLVGGPINRTDFLKICVKRSVLLEE